MEKQNKFAKLRGAIRTKYRTQRAFAEVLNLHPSTLSSKLNGCTQWSYNEVVTACKALDVPLTEASEYFFA